MEETVSLLLQNICTKFKIEGEYVGYTEIKAGHINNTYLVKYLKDDGALKKYVVQRINMYVFKNPRFIMDNIDLITGHIREKNPQAALHFHHTTKGTNYFVDAGGFWRVYTYVEGVGIDGAADRQNMNAAGRAFGSFQMLLSDFDASLLKETIPSFHDTELRFRHLYDSASDNPCGRLESVLRELEFAKSVEEISCRVTRSFKEGKLPLRVTHNDTKTNNVLVDKKTKEPICVIDLDTVMPGLIAHDFGDSIRYGANKAAEDEIDLTKVGLDMDLFRAFTEGFVGQVAPILTEEELFSLPLGALAMTMECGVRFLDDYLCGDRYFRIEYPEHNLSRARCQFALSRDMIAHMDEMRRIVEEVYRKTVSKK